MKSSFKPRIEKLEDRLAPATLTGVSSLPDAAGTYGRAAYQLVLEDAVPGWGASSYQYAFAGTYANTAFRGESLVQNKDATAGGTLNVYHSSGQRIAFNDDIVPANTPVAPGAALHLKPSPSGASAAHELGHTLGFRHEHTRPTSGDDVIVDGRIITGEYFDSAIRESRTGRIAPNLFEDADGAKGGNVEFEWKVEEGESAPPPDLGLKALGEGQAAYSAIAFVGGWGASSYQYS